MPPATQLKRGQVILFKGGLCRILSLTHITPGKGNAVIQTEIRNLRTGVKTENRFRSNEDVEIAEVATRTMQFLYESNGIYHFMDTENYQQYELTRSILGDLVSLLATESAYAVDLHEGAVLGLTLPPRLTLKILKTDPPQKGAAGKTKDATLETGLVIKVPLFIAEGDRVVVDTASQEYTAKG